VGNFRLIGCGKLTFELLMLGSGFLDHTCSTTVRGFVGFLGRAFDRSEKKGWVSDPIYSVCCDRNSFDGALANTICRRRRHATHHAHVLGNLDGRRMRRRWCHWDTLCGALEETDRLISAKHCA
jgi:hypothetical protein